MLPNRKSRERSIDVKSNLAAPTWSTVRRLRLRRPRLRRPRPQMLRRSGARPPRQIGVIGLLIAGIIATGVVVLSNLSLGAGTYRVELAQTAGLRVGESVQVAGVDVGEIQGIRLAGDRVVAEFTIDDAIQLGAQTTAEVRVATLLGTHYLQVKPAGRGRLERDTIALTRTSVPFNLQDVIDETANQLDQLDTVELSRALGAITDVLRRSGGEIGPSVEGIVRLSKVILRRSGDFEQLLDSTKEVTDQLSGSTQDLLSLMRTSSSFITELTGRREDVRHLLVSVESLSRTVEGMVADNESGLGPLLDDLDTVTTALQSQEKAMRVAARRLAVSSRYLANATGNGPWADLYVPDSQPALVGCLSGGCS